MNKVMDSAAKAYVYIYVYITLYMANIARAFHNTALRTRRLSPAPLTKVIQKTTTCGEIILF